ncbi:glycosyltransferase [Tabrizicola sp. YIM 78059]|uniref:glycosyltransferase n=1 Tax=Tabrizicola sp. YIM 78059 TaxID=2529861 RepID=UPI0010AA81FE|nr:glycosyltransferase [Tabrizicola sp. YIM 78059]
MSSQPSQCIAVGEASEITRAPILVVTRFSFLGTSGWKSDASRDAVLLFETARLRSRLDLFGGITLPSLRGQTDPDFHHLVLTSSELPEWAMEELKCLCNTAYDHSHRRFTILARPSAPARRPLRKFMERHFKTDHIVQVVLDDDDGLAIDFVARLRRDLEGLGPDDLAGVSARPFFISYALGYALVLRSSTGQGYGTGTEPVIFRQRYPFINAGLTMVGTPSGKNILAISHRKAPKRFGHRLLGGARMFLRTVHDFNDSRVEPVERWQPVVEKQCEADLTRRFPYLEGL